MTTTRYSYFGKPPAKVARPAADEPALRGKRVILSLPYGFVYDQRATSERHLDTDGNTTVDICSEQDWYRWMFTKQNPARQTYPIHLVWME